MCGEFTRLEPHRDKMGLERRNLLPCLGLAGVMLPTLYGEAAAQALICNKGADHEAELLKEDEEGVRQRQMKLRCPWNSC